MRRITCDNVHYVNLAKHAPPPETLLNDPHVMGCNADDKAMLSRQPKRLPALQDMLDDLGRPKTKDLAKTLDVSERTIRGWIKANNAPRAVMLALFWVTSWGRQWANAEAHDYASMQAGLADAFRRRNMELEKRIAMLVKIGKFESANDPITLGASLRDRALGLRPHALKVMAHKGNDP